MSGPPQPTTSPAVINRMQRRRDAMELRKANATYANIAQALGYPSARAAQRDVAKAIKKMPEDGLQDMRRVQREQYGHMAMKLWTKAQNGDLQAMDRWLRIQERLAALYGLDAAVKMELDSQTESHVTHAGASVLIVGGTEDEYLAAMRKAVGVDVDQSTERDTAMPAEGDDQRAVAASDEASGAGGETEDGSAGTE